MLVFNSPYPATPIKDSQSHALAPQSLPSDPEWLLLSTGRSCLSSALITQQPAKRLLRGTHYTANLSYDYFWSWMCPALTNLCPCIKITMGDVCAPLSRTGNWSCLFHALITQQTFIKKTTGHAYAPLSPINNLV